MLAIQRKPVDVTHDISYYAKDSRLTGEPDGKRYRWTGMIERFKMLVAFLLTNSTLFTIREGFAVMVEMITHHILGMVL